MFTRCAAYLERVLQSAAVPGQGRFREALTSVICGGMIYGAVMGAFGGVTPDRWLQILYSSCKVPLLLIVTVALATPSYFVINTVFGLRADFPEAMKAIAISQGTIGIVLASLWPFTIVWYCSNSSYQQGTLFNGVAFAVASITGQWVIRKRYAALVLRNPQHRTMLVIWIILYIFVGIQLGWTLRPFIGDPATAPTFFRKDTFGNAYVIVAELILEAVTGKR